MMAGLRRAERMTGLCADSAKLLMRRDNGLLTAYEAEFIATKETAPMVGVRYTLISVVLTMWLRDKYQTGKPRSGSTA